MGKINEKSWREQTIDNVGAGDRKVIYFDDTKPNYVLLSNPCHSPLYVSSSPAVSDQEADIIVPVNGVQLYSQAHGLKEMYIICYDNDLHKVRVKSWEGEFDPATINQTQKTVPQYEDQSLGNVTVTNFPNIQDIQGDVAISNFPAVQQIQGGITVENTGAIKTINVDYLTKMDNMIALLTQIELNTRPV